jgi:hypothetical protein
MSVELDGEVIRLCGACRVEDAETLLVLLQCDRQRVVDISGAAHIHAAVVQVLLAFQPRVSGTSHDPFIAAFVAPILQPAIPPFTPYP